MRLENKLILPASTFEHCEKFLLGNLNVGKDVAFFFSQLVVQIQTLVFLNQVPTHLLDKHIGIIQ